MTEDYKDKLLKYITGNISSESGNNIPSFDDDEVLNKNIAENIKTILTDEQNANYVIALGKIYNEIYESYLIYGYYQDTSENYYGFIYLVDSDLNEIQMITEFASGTKLFPITALNQDENNNMYGLTYSIDAVEMTSKVLLFNNIFASGQATGVYKAILRNDYIVPYNYNQAPYRQNRITKSPDGATYYIVLSEDNKEKFVRFTINVGSTNEWVVATIPYGFYARFDVRLDKSSGNEILKFYGINTASPSSYYEYNINGDTATQVKSIQLPYIAQFLSQVYVKDLNNIYLFISYTTAGYAGVFKVNGNQLTQIYRINLEPSGTTYKICYGTLFEINGGLFFYLNKKETYESQLYLAFIKEDNTIVITDIGQYDGTDLFSSFYSYVDFYYKNNYNLVNIYVPYYSTTNTTKKFTLDYNSINYNGVAYENINSLEPTKARIYDNNDKIIFARNLYNKTINANTTISTINIPNTMLNNITMHAHNLIGSTNYVLIEDTENITKNIYEDLNINFYNTIRMVNENDPNNIIFTQIGSNRLNSSSSNLLDYNNAKATKIRINYADNTTQIMNVIFNPLKNYFYTKFSLQVNKEINSIEFISNDENTVYNTISPQLTVGKVYVIRQCITIDNLEPTEQLLYNNQQVYYNSEEIYY